ncbi:hypothetical protein DFJ77DRAFT_261633 [Powellomyces hirtus]|nr:hypothetical protein DFJ77DRAFT_261633 [Powellomyces hirtus]
MRMLLGCWYFCFRGSASGLWPSFLHSFIPFFSQPIGPNLCNQESFTHHPLIHHPMYRYLFTVAIIPRIGSKLGTFLAVKFAYA